MDSIYIDKDISPLLSEFERRDTFSLDLETTGLSPIDSRILLCQIGFGGLNFVINVGSVSIEPILPYLQSPKWKKIIQNVKFESKFFQHFYKTDIVNTFDTYLAELLINTESKQSSLEYLAKHYLDIDLNKKIRESFHNASPITAFTEEQIDYAANDVIVLFPIMEAQKKKIQEAGMEKIAEIEFDLAGVVAAMENEGIPIDVQDWKNKLTDYEKRHEESRLKMNSLIFDDTGIPEQMGLFVRDGININSVPQIQKAFKQLGIDVENTSEREISLVNHPAAKELLNYRKLQKVMSSYGTSFIDKIHPFTGRLHPDFQQIGAATGRFSCREPNVQQIPEEFRGCVGLKDYSIISADYSQMELRILAELSKDLVFLRAFRSGHDLHRTTASIMFNIPMEKVSHEQRFIGKTLNFGITYGMGPDKLTDMLNTEAAKYGWESYSLERSQALLTRYKKTYSQASRWLYETGVEALKTGVSKTMLGRVRTFTMPFETDSDERRKKLGSIRRQGSNTPIQGTNADITKLAMVNLYRDFKQYKFRAHIINQVHDEIVVLAHKSQSEPVKDLIVESMMGSAQEIIQSVPVKVDATISDTWIKG